MATAGATLLVAGISAQWSWTWGAMLLGGLLLGAAFAGASREGR